MAVLGTSKCYAADKASLIARILLEDHIRGCVAHGIRSGEGDAHIGRGDGGHPPLHALVRMGWYCGTRISARAPRSAPIPPQHLESLFGPDVRSALDSLKVELEKKRRGEPSALMDALITYEWKEALGPYTRDPAEIVWK